MLPAGQKRQNESVDGDGDDSDDSEAKPVKRNGRRKIKIEYIEDKNRRHITFSKRKAGIMKKAYELSTLTGTQVLLLVVSETGLVYTFTTTKLQPIVTKPEGKNLIQACLNTPDPAAITESSESRDEYRPNNDMASNPTTAEVSPRTATSNSPMMQQQTSPNVQMRPAVAAPPAAPVNVAPIYPPPQAQYNPSPQQQQPMSAGANTANPNAYNSQQQRYPNVGGGFNGNLPQPQSYSQQQQQQQQQAYGQPQPHPSYYGQPQQQNNAYAPYWGNNPSAANNNNNNGQQQQQGQQRQQGVVKNEFKNGD